MNIEGRRRWVRYTGDGGGPWSLAPKDMGHVTDLSDLGVSETERNGRHRKVLEKDVLYHQTLHKVSQGLRICVRRKNGCNTSSLDKTKKKDGGGG